MVDKAAEARYLQFMKDRPPQHPELSMFDALMRAAIEQGAHDGTNPRNKKDGRDRNKTRSEQSIWEHVIYRAATYGAEVRMLGTRYYLSRLSKDEQAALLDAYRLARG